MVELLNKCDENYKTMPCCHTDDRVCLCSICWDKDFYCRADSYDCAKKLNHYVLNYGPSFSSEIYHYLSNSKILENHFNNKTIRILSLGCGFAPDLLAVTRYVLDNDLNIEIEYNGKDRSTAWESARYETDEANFETADVSNNINLTNYNLVFLVKLFSTLYKNNLSDQFLKVFRAAVANQLSRDCFIVFADINDRDMGRDVFHSRVNRLFSKSRQFYFSIGSAYTGNNWTPMTEKKLAFEIPTGLSLEPKTEIGKTVFFEYRK